MKKSPSDNIYALPTLKGHPKPIKGCAECKFYIPNLDQGYNKQSFGDWFLGRPKVPSANAMKYATCTGLGGDYASIVRTHQCKGDMWKSKEE